MDVNDKFSSDLSPAASIGGAPSSELASFSWRSACMPKAGINAVHPAASKCAVPALYRGMLSTESRRLLRFLESFGHGLSVNYGSETPTPAGNMGKEHVGRVCLYFLCEAASLWIVCCIQLCQHSLSDKRRQTHDLCTCL